MPCDLFGQPIAPRASDIRMEVEFDLVGRARLWLRYVWDEDMPAAAFLMNNPSIAGSDGSPFDPTAKRTIHFAHTHGCGSVWLVNWCPLIATHPADLWKILAGGGEEWWQKREHWQRVNGLAVERASRAASIRVVACGPDGFRRHPDLVRRALQAFLWHYPPAQQEHEAMCLGVTPEGAPLHPLARGKFAITNATRLTKWAPNWGEGRPFGTQEQTANTPILSE